VRTHRDAARFAAVVTIAAAGAAAVSALLACDVAARVRIAGATREIPAEQFPARRLELVREQARADLHCAEGVDVGTLPANASQDSPDFADLFSASGCGRRVLYAQVMCEDFSFVPISQEPSDPRALAEPPLGKVCESLRRARRYVDLDVAGARDLGCPRADVVPENPRLHRTRVVEGCGKRAFYADGVEGGPVRVVPTGEDGGATRVSPAPADGGAAANVSTSLRGRRRRAHFERFALAHDRRSSTPSMRHHVSLGRLRSRA
jgi:hypothetical protein